MFVSEPSVEFRMNDENINIKDESRKSQPHYHFAKQPQAEAHDSHKCQKENSTAESIEKTKIHRNPSGQSTQCQLKTAYDDREEHMDEQK